MQALSAANKLKISQQKETKLKESPVQKLETLIRKYKFAITEEIKAKAETDLKRYAI